MAEVDPLVLEISAKLGQYKAELRASTALATQAFARQEKAIQNLERQMQKSSGAIGASLKGIAASLAGAFSAQQIGGLIDNFTRLQNSLRVAGLEGDGLANVQEKLLGLSKRYGVSINELADLYGKSSQAASELGASESQLLQITEASAQALKITGTSAAQAQGALLGLTQALSSGIVRAEEFNQINEGGLRPLLQVAANTEKYGGSVAKLRAAVVDGKVSSQEFYQAILQGSAELDSKASKATLTLAGAFTALASQLTVYVGEASAANGVTAGLAAAIGALADNLDTIIPLLAIIGVAIGGRLAAAALLGGNGLRALSAYASIATTSLAGTALAARGAGAALLGAFGGPVGLAITALVLGLGYLATRTDEASEAASRAKAQAERTSAALDIERKVTDQLTSAKGRERAATLASIQASRARAAQAIQTAKALVQEARASLAAERVRLKRAANLGLVGDVENGAGGIPDPSAKNRANANADASPIGIRVRQFEKNIKIAEKGIADAESFVAAIDKGIAAANAPVKLASTGVDSGKSKASKNTSGGPSGPSVSDIAERFNSQIISIAQQTLAAQASMAVSADERAEFELRALELTRKQALEQIETDKDYSATQKERLRNELDSLDFEERARIEKARLAQIAQEQADLAEALARNEIARLEDEYDLATSVKERARIAAEIVDAETQAALEAIDRQLLDEQISDAKRAQLKAIRAGIVAEGASNQRKAADANKGAAGQYLDQLNRLNYKDEAERFGVDALKDLNAGLAEAIVNGGDLGDVLEDTGKRFLAQLIEMTLQLLVIKPLLESLGGAMGGGSGGGFAAILGSLFGRASGGRVNAGSVYRVNESQSEFFQPDVSGNIIPMSKMRAAGSATQGGGGTSTIRLELSGDIRAEMVDVATGVSIEVTRTASGPIIESAVKETFRRGQRPNIGR